MTQTRAVGELLSDRVEITAEFAEPITGIAVPEGEPVTAGQTLLTLNTERAEARLRDAEAALAEATARRDELLRGPRSEQIAAARASVEGAEQELAFRRSELQRIREIHERGLAAADLLDRAVAAHDAAVADRKQKRARLEELLAGTTVEELAQAEQAVAARGGAA